MAKSSEAAKRARYLLVMGALFTAGVLVSFGIGYIFIWIIQ